MENIPYENSSLRRAGVAILISNKMYLSKILTQDKEEDCTQIEVN